MSEKKLFTEFPPLTTEQWEAVIQVDLKGADYQKKLIWKNIEGIDVNPYYRAEHLENLPHTETLPGNFPFIRGNHIEDNSWLIREDILADNPIDANSKAIELCRRGIDSIGFIISDEAKLTESYMAVLLENLPSELLEINFLTGKRSKDLVEILNENNIRIEGSVDFDPIGYYMQTGKFEKESINAFDQAKELIIASRDWPNFSSILVNGSMFRQAGAGLVQELGLSLAVGAEYLQQISQRGLNVHEIPSNIRFNFSVGGNYFMEIAKFRAARFLWAKLLTAFDIKESEQVGMIMHVETSTWNKSLYDAHTNMIRTTTEAMSATLGGIHSLMIGPYNQAFGKPDDFAQRIARNQQLLLREESYFDRVIDPAAGSYYIESLSQGMIEKAWQLFLEIEEKGGIIEAFRNGYVQSIVNETARQRDLMIAQRKEILVGVNQYPNSGETLENIDVDQNITFKNNDIEILKPYRGAQAFEYLRNATDKYSQTNDRPKAFMITMGNLAMRRARAQFASNFFACGGIEPIDNNGFANLEVAVESFKNSKANIAVLCSSDDEYETLAPQLKALLPAGSILVVAGAPACMSKLQAEGITNFIHLKVNVLEELNNYLRQLTILA